MESWFDTIFAFAKITHHERIYKNETLAFGVSGSKAKGGFTLIELILSIAISAIVSLALFSSFTQIQKSADLIDDFMSIDRNAIILQNQLGKDISGAFIPLTDEKLEKIFYSVNENNKLKELTFITCNPMQIYGQTKPRIARVIYSLRENRENLGTFSLFRKESSQLLYGAEKEAVEYAIVNNIKEFSVEYVNIKDVQGKKEIVSKKDWLLNSQDKDLKIPQFIIFKITFVGKNLQRMEQYFEFRYTIYSYKIEKPKSSPFQTNSKLNEQLKISEDIKKLLNINEKK